MGLGPPLLPLPLGGDSLHSLLQTLSESETGNSPWRWTDLTPDTVLFRRRKLVNLRRAPRVAQADRHIRRFPNRVPLLPDVTISVEVSARHLLKQVDPPLKATHDAAADPPPRRAPPMP